MFGFQSMVAKIRAILPSAIALRYNRAWSLAPRQLARFHIFWQTRALALSIRTEPPMRHLHKSNHLLEYETLTPARGGVAASAMGINSTKHFLYAVYAFQGIPIDVPTIQGGVFSAGVEVACLLADVALLQMDEVCSEFFQADWCVHWTIVKAKCAVVVFRSALVSCVQIYSPAFILYCTPIEAFRKYVELVLQFEVKTRKYAQPTVDDRTINDIINHFNRLLNRNNGAKPTGTTGLILSYKDLPH